MQWVNTQSKDERNAEIVSQRVQEWLNSKDLSKAVTMDYQELKEYWLAVDKEVLIYNYGNSTFYLLELPVTVKTFYNYMGNIYMGTSDGEIMKWDKDDTTYDGSIIKAVWQSGFYDFNVEYRRKTMRRLWITLKPEARTSLKINYISDRDSGTESREISSFSIDFNHINFGEFSFQLSRNVNPFKIKLKSKKFTFLKLVLSNEKASEKLTINTISIKKSYGGESK